MKLQNTSPNRSCIERRSWSVLDARQVESSTTTWILAKLSQQRSITTKSTKYTKSYNICAQHWSIERDPILFHDNARPHVPQMTLQKLNEWPTEF
uniref:Histone-lysine N-methyltransferase SETMAR n=1 Tax=Heterorhabditis bacteriophora TaxID=37862 RepID=A0A1I7XIK4_HETBA